MQHRQEVLAKKDDRLVGLENVAGRPLAVMSPSGLFSWNSPEFLLRRNVVTVALAAANLAPEEPPQDKSFNGRTLKSAGIPASANADVDTAIAAGEHSPMAITKVADGVYFARAYSHNSMVPERHLLPGSWLTSVSRCGAPAQIGP
jgi:hypothetical protein